MANSLLLIKVPIQHVLKRPEGGETLPFPWFAVVSQSLLRA